MDAPIFENLDLACAKLGKSIAERSSKELERLVASALAVLEEQGIYALFLFLSTQGGDREENKNVRKKIYEFLKATPQQAPLLSENSDLFESLQQLAKDVDKLILARDLVRQALVYARYHARVPQKNEVQP